MAEKKKAAKDAPEKAEPADDGVKPASPGYEPKRQWRDHKGNRHTDN